MDFAENNGYFGRSISNFFSSFGRNILIGNNTNINPNGLRPPANGGNLNQVAGTQSTDNTMH